MQFPHFMRIEREEADGATRLYVLHGCEPKLMMEVSPDARGTATIKCVCVPNSWTGNYSRYAPVLTRAEAFLRAVAENQDDGANRLQA